MSHLTDRLTADVASSILNEYIDSIKKILINDQDKRIYRCLSGNNISFE